MQPMVIRLLAVFVVSGIIKLTLQMIVGGPIAVVLGVLVDIGVLWYIYQLLRRYGYVGLKRIMLFLSGITLISILVEVGVLRGDFGNLIILLAIAWILFGKDGLWGGRRRGRNWF
jgi:hypothetical protein